MTSPCRLLAYGLAAIVLGPAMVRAQAPGGSGGGALGPQSVVAVVNGTPITLAQVDKQAGLRVQTLEAEQMDIRRQALDALIDQAVMASRTGAAAGAASGAPAGADTARAAGATRGGAMTAAAPLDRDELLDAAAEVIRQRAQAAPLSRDELRAMIERTLVSERGRRAVAEARAKAQVAVYLPSITVDMDLADDPVLGPADAPVTVAVFSDFQCPYCAKSAPIAEHLIARFPDKVRVVFRDFPLLSIHKEAALAAEAGSCANAQGKFWPLHDLMFANQQQLGKERMLALAQQSGLDAKTFASCLDSKRFSAEWRSDQAEGEALGVTGTPTWFVNGRKVGAVPLDRLETLITEALRSTPQTRPAGSVAALDR
jgi:protein-disulfide isomerase